MMAQEFKVGSLFTLNSFTYKIVRSKRYDKHIGYDIQCIVTKATFYLTIVDDDISYINCEPIQMVKIYTYINNIEFKTSLSINKLSFLNYEEEIQNQTT